MNFVLLANEDRGRGMGLPQSMAAEAKDVEVWRRAIGREAEDRAVGRQTLERGQISFQAAIAGRFGHKVQRPMSKVQGQISRLLQHWALDLGLWTKWQPATISG